MAKNSGRSSLGSLVHDRNQVDVQIGSEFVVADATGTPQTSPLSYTTGVYTIVVPDRAVEFICSPTTDLNIGSAVGMTTYDLIKANTKESLPCAKMQNIYVQRNSASGTLYFRFTLV